MAKKTDDRPELRQDLTSGDWVLFAPSRNKRPGKPGEGQRTVRQPKTKCIFENPKKAGGGVLIASYPDGVHWRLQVVPNKFPAVLVSDEKAQIRKENAVFNHIEGYGHQEIIITKDHDRNFAKLGIEDSNLLFNVFRERYRAVAKDKNTAYISIYHNWGRGAGASVYHPHYQFLSTPVIPPMAERSLTNARRYHRKRKECIHCFEIKLAQKHKKWVLYEDELSIAFAPYAPKEPFEFRVSPKGHSPYFEDASEFEVNSMVKSLAKGIGMLERKIKHANYNFYLHTSPTKHKDRYAYYHWHIQVVPRLNIDAGFELTTGIEINATFPETAVRILKGE